MPHIRSRLRHLTPTFAALAFATSAIFAHTATAEKIRTIAVLETMTLKPVQARTTALRRHLEKLGYREGENIKTIVLNAEGEQERGETLIKATISEFAPDLIVSNATLASKAVRKILSGTKTPQVFLLVADPVGAGLVPTIGKASGSNITGTTHVLPVGQKVELLAQLAAKKLTPGPLRIALVHSSYPSAVSEFKEISKIGKSAKGLEFTGVEIDYTPAKGVKYKDAVRGMAAEAVEKLNANASQFDVFWICNGPNAINPEFLQTLLSQTKKPMIYANNLSGVKLGGLFTIFSNADTNGHDAAIMVDAILKGTSSAKIPVIRPNKFDVAVNVSTASKLGIVIPAEVLELAGDLIFQ